LQVEYREYLTSEQFIQSQRSVNVLASADLGILPKGPFTLRLNDTFVHTVDPRNLDTTTISSTATTGQFGRNYNRGGLLASYRIGSKLELGLGDYVEFNLWEDSTVGRFGDMIYNDAQAFFRVRFLPQTIGTVNVRVGYTHYLNAPLFESIPVRITAGVSSLITTWFGVGASIGYGGSFHQETTQSGLSFNSVIANLEARFFLPHAARVTLGYDRDFFDSLFSTWYSDDRVYVAFDQPLIHRLTAHLDGGVRFRHYQGLRTPGDFGYSNYVRNGVAGASDRDDLIWDVHAELTVRATSWLGFAASYNVVGDDTDFAFRDTAGRDTSAGYIKHSVFLRADIAY